MIGMEKVKKPGPIGKTAKEYSEATTIHGIAYLFENGLWMLERFLWILAVCLGVFFAIFLSVKAYVEWKDNPVLTTVATTGFPIEKVEFPAITICAQVIPFLATLYKCSSIFLFRVWPEKL